MPTYAYQVSGEYAMLQAAIQNGWLDGNQVILEVDTENTDFVNLIEYTKVAKELSISINKLGVLLNQAIRYKVFKTDLVAEKLETDLYSLYLGTLENIKKYKKLLEKNNIKIDFEKEIEKVIKEQEEKEE